MQIIILGMHRSGTSMVARALNLMGAYLGEADELVPAAMLLHWLAYHKDILERDARKYFDALVPFPQ